MTSNKADARQPKEEAHNDAATATITTVEHAEMKNKKRIERLEQNRISARESRKRKKTMIEELQRTVITLSRENKELNERNESLRRQLMEIGAKYPNIVPLHAIMGGPNAGFDQQAAAAQGGAPPGAVPAVPSMAQAAGVAAANAGVPPSMFPNVAMYGNHHPGVAAVPGQPTLPGWPAAATSAAATAAPPPPNQPPRPGQHAAGGAWEGQYSAAASQTAK